MTARDLPSGNQARSEIWKLGGVTACSDLSARLRSHRRACLSSLSVTRASSLSFSFFSSASDFASGARKAIVLPSWDQEKWLILRLPLVRGTDSPPLMERRQICWLASRLERKARDFPSGDHLGEDSDFSE